jgi:hypothetical protein
MTKGINEPGVLRVPTDSRERSIGRAKIKRSLENRNVEKYNFLGITTNATATELFQNGDQRLPVGVFGDGSVSLVEVKAVARLNTGGKVAAEIRRYLVKVVGAEVTLLESGAPAVVDHIGEAAYTVALVDDTNVLKLKVTGALAEQVYWNVDVEVISFFPDTPYRG